MESHYRTTPSFCKEVQQRLDQIEQLYLPKACQLLEDMQSKIQVSTKSNSRDLVTDADLACEELFLTAIRQEFSQDSILSEESGIHTNSKDQDIHKDFCWIIDPLDGTTNYAHAMPLYSISLGLSYNDEAVGGLIALPALGQVYRACPGQGATKNNTPIHVSPFQDFSSALVATGFFPYIREGKVQPLFSGLEVILSQCRGVRHTGSSALDLCWLAEGIFTAHYELELKPWDTTAGVALVREAGGEVTDFTGRHHKPEMQQITASNGYIHQDLLKALEVFHKIPKYSESPSV